MKKELAAAVAFWIAGVLMACLFGYDYFKEYGFLNAERLQAFANAEPDVPKLFAAILWERGKLFFVLLLMASSPLKKLMPLLIRLVLCFAGGLFLSACMISMNGSGALFFLLSLFPHGIFYLISLILLCKIDDWRISAAKNAALKLLVFYLLIALLFLMAAWRRPRRASRFWQNLPPRSFHN